MKPSIRHSWVFLLLVLCGCGDGKGSLQGTVTLDGATVENGYITLVPLEGTPGSGGRGAIVNGNYVLESENRILPGSYRVEISAQRKTGKKVPVGSPAPPGTVADEMVEAIPIQYNKRSTLRFDVPPGKTTKNFELTSR
jgi:hypothetical protein